MKNDPTIWRINIKTDTDLDARRFCIEKNIIGAGWSIENELDDGSRNGEKYYEIGKAAYPNCEGFKKTANAMIWRMQKGDLCWTRDWNGFYFLGKIDGPFIYQVGEPWDEFDVHMTRGCEWVAAGPADAVPGDIRRSFTSAALQRVYSHTAATISEIMYSEKSGEGTPNRANDIDLFSLLGPDELEDLVGIYLQIEKDWAIVPSTSKRSTPTYEFVLRHRSTGERAFLQVKSGNAEFIPPSNLGSSEKFFVFVNSDDALPHLEPPFEVLSKDAILKFARSNSVLLPEIAQHLLGWAEVS